MMKTKNSFKFKWVSLLIMPFTLWIYGNAWAKDIHFSDTVKPSAECKTDYCPSGAYLIDNAAEFARISDVLAKKGQVDQSTGHWTNNRYAILLPQGNYQTSQPFQLGYYTQVIGLGQLPTDVNLTPGIAVYNQCPDPSDRTSCKLVGGLNNFWRGIENVQMTVTPEVAPLRLAISQATALRRLNVTGAEQGLLLCDWDTPSYECGYTSGGFLANSKINNLKPGSQQQWLTRNSELENYEKAVWNSIYVGTTLGTFTTTSTANHYGPSQNDWSNFPITKVDETPIVREKPYLTKSGQAWQVVVPKLKHHAVGYDWSTENAEILSIDKFHVLTSNPDAKGVTTISSAEIAGINTELAQDDRHLIVMPGVYHLEGTINVTQKDTVVLGLGIPALVCMQGPCMNVEVEQGVKLAGLTLDAGYNETDHLLRVGKVSTGDNSVNPHSLSDIYIRIAETLDEDRSRGIRQTKTAVIINSNDVIGDNLWIWRGDHDKASTVDPYKPSANLVKWDENTADYGLIVDGNNVTMYGLAVEHFQDYQTLWYGENGRVYFYQSEAPYDFDSEDGALTWTCTDYHHSEDIIDVGGCPAYVIAKNVEKHTAFGVGVYSYFAFEEIQLPSGIKAPSHDGIHLEHIISHWLNGIPGSAILNLVQDYDNQCWGLIATCSEIGDQDLCLDNGADFKQTSVLGAFSKETFAKTDSCNL